MDSTPLTTSSKPSGLRIAFFGTPEFAAHILDYLVEHGEQVVVAVTTPDKQQGRGLKVRSSAVKEAAVRHGISTLTPLKLRDPDFQAELKAVDADIFCVVAYKILPREVFTMPRLGAFNVHASLLPKYRGAAPINWAIMRGDKLTGITTFLLDDKVDTGQMLLREEIPIADDMTAGELHDALMEVGARLALASIRGLADGSLHPSSQDDAQATSAPKIFPPDCVVNFAQPAAAVHDFIRGLSPYPAAVTTLGGARTKLLRSRIAPEVQSLSPGDLNVSDDRKHLFVGTMTIPIEILELQKEGKRAMLAEEFLRGARDL